jgi:hypothetical protein
MSARSSPTRHCPWSGQLAAWPQSAISPRTGAWSELRETLQRETAMRRPVESCSSRAARTAVSSAQRGSVSRASHIVYVNLRQPLCLCLYPQPRRRPSQWRSLGIVRAHARWTRWSSQLPPVVLKSRSTIDCRSTRRSTFRGGTTLTLTPPSLQPLG